MEKNIVLALTMLVLAVIMQQVHSRPAWEKVFDKQRQNQRDYFQVKNFRYYDDDDYADDYSGYDTDEYYDSSEEYFDSSEEYFDNSEEYYDSSEEYYDSSEENARAFYESGRRMTDQRNQLPNIGYQRNFKPQPRTNNQFVAAEMKLNDLRHKMDNLRQKMDEIENEINPWNGYYDKK